MSTLTIPQALELAINHHQAGRLAEAETLYRQILAQHPNHPEALHLLGVIAGSVGQIDQADQLIRQAIAVAPDQLTYYTNLSRLLHPAGRANQAVDVMRRAVERMPASAEAWFDLGSALNAARQTDLAIEACQNTLRLMPRHAHALNQLGMLLYARGRLADAVRCFETALEIDPNMFEAHGNLGVLMAFQGQHAQAVLHYQRALSIAPDQFLTHYNLGLALAELDRPQEAEGFYNRAIELNPNYAPAYNNRGNVLLKLGRYDEAIASYRRVVELQPDSASGYTNLATVFSRRAQHAEARACDRRALELEPGNALSHGNLCYGMLFQQEFDAADIAAELRRWNQRHAAPLRECRRPHTNSRDPDRRLRIGYVSPDFRDHVIAHNMIPIFRHRDRDTFEVFCYSNLAVKDAVTAQFEQLSDHWRDIHAIDDAPIAEQIRDDGIDILVDLALHLAGNRLLVFARKPAPVQVTFAGYPGSTGLETIDYRITDGYLEPPEKEGRHVEKTIRIPSFWCFDPMDVNLPVNDLPAAAMGDVTFGCLNHFRKVNDGMLDLWISVLAAVPRSRLLLLSAEGSHRARTLEYFSQKGLAPQRVEFVTPRARPKYLALYHQVDIGLDTLPYNGHSTSLDALWMGVPVLTLVGSTEVGRAGLSQLSNLGLPELITRTPAEYVQAAIDLARHPDRLKTYRAELRSRMEKSVLMDGVAFTRAIEATYRQMWRLWCQSPTYP